MIDGGGFSLVEHRCRCALAAPLHRQAREDEHSYILEGRVGALLGHDPARFAKANLDMARARLRG